MVPMGANTDEWISDVANYVRNAFGNTTRPYVTPEQVAAVRKATPRRRPWTLPELEPTIPTLVGNLSDWKLSASHNSETVANVSAGAGRWDTGAPQEPGMWFQIELPQASTISEVQFDSSAAGRANAGLGGFGGLGVTPPAAAAPAPPRGAGPAGAAGRGGRGGARGAARGGGGRGRGGAPATGPVSYSLQLSMDGNTWGTPVAQGDGDTPTTIATFKPSEARFIRITQTGTARNGELWGIVQIRIYQAPSTSVRR
jgi:hypothetical protein